MQPIILSSTILISSLVWTWIALRKMRSKPMVVEAGLVEDVSSIALILAVLWVGSSTLATVQGLLEQIIPSLAGEQEAPVLSLKTLKSNAMLGGGVAFILAVVYSLGQNKRPVAGAPGHEIAGESEPATSSLPADSANPFAATTLADRRKHQTPQLRASRAILLGVLGFAASIGPVLMVQVAMQSVLGPPDTSHPILEFLKKNRTSDAIFWIGATAVVVAPLLEELVYRVILQGALRSRIDRNAAVIVVALTFCFVHGWPNMVGLLPLAIVLGVLYDRTNSYLAVVTTHATFNMFMLLMEALRL